MNTICQEIMAPMNMQKLGQGALSGVFLGSIGFLLSNCMDKSAIDDEDQVFFFLNRNDDILQPLMVLTEMLRINGNTTDEEVMPTLREKLNTMAGFDELADDKTEALPLHINYTVNELSHRITFLLNRIINQKFVIPSLGLDICTKIEEIIEALDNIQHNVLQESNLRIMNA